MNSNDRTTLSKTLSKILRHKAIDEGLLIRSNGYISLSALLARPKLKKLSANLEMVQQVVEADNKGRFNLLQEGDGEWFIRANQGHSLIVEDLELTRITDAQAYPTVLHGTTLLAWQQIRHEGLNKMSRNHIHLATGKFGVVKSGVRKNCEVFIYIDLARAMADDISFFESSNGVVLTTGKDGTLAPQYFSRVENVNGESLLDHEQQLTDAVERVTLDSQLERRKLFGAAIQTTLPKTWLDASLVRQVPDTQEVFLDKDDAERSIIIELVERLDVPDQDAAMEHYKVLAEDNDAKRHEIISTTTIASATQAHDFKSLVLGVQKIAKFNTRHEMDICVVLGIIRLVKVATDVLVMYNSPHSNHSERQGEELIRAALNDFEINDWSLFPECC